MRQQAEIRPATFADLVDIQQLAAQCPEAASWNTSVWQQVLNSAEGLQPGRIALVAVLESALVGFAALHMVADEGELENLCVAPAFKRRGVGRALCEALLPHAEAGTLKRIHLEVRETNGAAIAFYRELGFTIEGKRRKYYTAPTEDAVLLTKHL